MPDLLLSGRTIQQLKLGHYLWAGNKANRERTLLHLLSPHTFYRKHLLYQLLSAISFTQKPFHKGRIIKNSPEPAGGTQLQANVINLWR